MDGHNLRAPMWDDLEPAAAVLAADQEIDGWEAALDTGYLRGEWERPGFDLATDAWVAVDGDGTVIGYAQVNDAEDDLAASWGVVHPAQRGRGVGSALFDRLEARAAEMLAGSRDARFRHFANADDEAAAELLRSRGLHLIRHHWTMSIDLSQKLEAGPAPAGILIAPLGEHADLREVFTLIEEAFDEHWCEVTETYERWLEDRTQGPDFDPTLWRLARDEGRLVGALVGAALGDQGWVTLLGVRREARRRGIGAAQLHEAFAAFAASGLDAAVLNVDAANPTGATALYERAGMHVAGRFDLWERAIGPPRVG